MSAATIIGLGGLGSLGVLGALGGLGGCSKKGEPAQGQQRDREPRARGSKPEDGPRARRRPPPERARRAARRAEPRRPGIHPYLKEGCPIGYFHRGRCENGKNIDALRLMPDGTLKRREIGCGRLVPRALGVKGEPRSYFKAKQVKHLPKPKGRLDGGAYWMRKYLAVVILQHHAPLGHCDPHQYDLIVYGPKEKPVFTAKRIHAIERAGILFGKYFMYKLDDSGERCEKPHQKMGIYRIADKKHFRFDQDPEDLHFHRQQIAYLAPHGLLTCFDLVSFKRHKLARLPEWPEDKPPRIRWIGGGKIKVTIQTETEGAMDSSSPRTAPAMGAAAAPMAGAARPARPGAMTAARPGAGSAAEGDTGSTTKAGAKAAAMARAAAAPKPWTKVFTCPGDGAKASGRRTRFEICPKPPPADPGRDAAARAMGERPRPARRK
jgi:hypothetical protein